MKEKLLFGIPDGKYPGSFPSSVEQIIKNTIRNKSCLHLFSGSSLIGNERVDINHSNATKNMDVFDFVKTDKRQWDFVVLDPDYNIFDKEKKLKGHGNTASVSASVPKRRALTEYFQKHVKNIIWLDLSAPHPAGFYRKDWWVYLPGGYRHVRFLSWLQREGERLT